MSWWDSRLPDAQVMLMAEKIVEAGVFSMVITGGEPLVRKHLTKHLIKYFKDCNMHVSLNTNLLLLDQEALEYMMGCYLDGMLISCPSLNAETYRFMTGGGNLTRFLQNTKLVIANKQHFAINMVVNRHNFHDIRETAKGCADLGVERFGATPMGLNLQNPDLDNLLTRDQVVSLIEELMWIQENLGMKVDIFEAMAKCVFPAWVKAKNPFFMKRKCQAGKTIVSVSNNGDVRPCSHNPRAHGNILRESLEAIWEKMGEWRDHQMVPERCRSCKQITNCYGGCRITAKAYTNDCKGEDPWMDNPISNSEKSTNNSRDISLEPSMVVSFSKIFRWRKEKDDCYLMSSTPGNQNPTMINEHMFSFVEQLRGITPISLGELSRTTGCDFGNIDFQRVIKLLITRNFLTLSETNQQS